MNRRKLLTLSVCLFFFGALQTGCTEATKKGKSDATIGVDTNVGQDTAPPECAANQCSIGGSCYDNADPDPANACQACIVAIDTGAWTPNDAGTCDDGNLCTDSDGCISGSCEGEDRVCDDANPCTDDSCDTATGECVGANNTAPCDDGSPCTSGASCSGGSCQAGTEPADCDDKNPCTDDGCDEKTGCTATAIHGGACDDGDSCTANEVCEAGICSGVQVMDCDDLNACTIDICDVDTGCSHESIAAQCADDNPCTNDLCDPDKGCVYPFNDQECDDENPCTQVDKCIQGACLGTPIDVDDGNACTTDSCDKDGGITHSANSNPCDDGDACTLGDTCVTGTCQSGESYLDCEDDNVCTDDWCLAATGCKNDPNNVLCDDGTECTQDDICSGGTCDGQALDCDDGKACTEDSCNSATGCINEFKLSADCRPEFDISFPERGQTVQGILNDMTVTIVGNVSSGAGDIALLKVNGAIVNTNANGDFTHQMNVQVGGNIITMVATDTMGTKRERVQSFLWSSGYRKPTNKSLLNGLSSESIGLWLGKDVIDDGTRNYNSPKNLATIAELVVQNFDVADSIPSPAGEAGPYDIYVTNLQHDAPTITINPMSGKLRLNGKILNVSADFEAKANWLPDPSGTITISKITLQADIILKVVSHELVAEVKDVSVTIQENDIDIDGNGLVGSVTAFFVGFFKGTIANKLSDEFETAVKNEIGPALETALASLTLAETFEIPSLAQDGSSISVDLVSDFEAVTTTSQGLELVLRGAGYADSATPHDGFKYKGIPNRASCGMGNQSLVIPGDYDLEASLADDMVNSLLFASFRGGLLEFVVPDSMFGQFQLSDYGISDLKLIVSGMVAPTVSDCNDQGALRLFVGDVGVTADLKLLGIPMTMQVWASFEVDVDISAVGACDSQAGTGCPGNLACESAVCQLDPFCCETQWDIMCSACANSGVGFGGVDCSGATGLCKPGISLQLGDISVVETEIQVQEDDLIVTEGVISNLIETQLVPNLTASLAGSVFNVPLPNMNVGGVIPGIPEGTTLGINPQVDKRINGNTVIQGTLK